MITNLHQQKANNVLRINKHKNTFQWFSAISEVVCAGRNALLVLKQF